MSTEIVSHENTTPATQGTGAGIGEMTVEAMVSRKRKIKQVLEQVMEPGVHYGTIPGCGDKPTLYKSGAEVLATTFGLAPTFEVKMAELGDDHREYRIVCTLKHIATGAILGEGVGCCSTLETKYAFVKGQPRANPADVYNTVLKMAKKRAQVDCTLTAVGASDILAQDLEDLDPEDRKQPVRQERKSEPSAEAKQLEAMVKRINAAEDDEQLAQLIPELTNLPASVKQQARAVYQKRRADFDQLPA